MPTTVKKACKCRNCKTTLNVGDKAEWYSRTIGHASVVRGSTFVRWEMECADREACKQRIYQAHLAKQAEEATKEAQQCVDTLRSGELGVIPEEVISKMIAHFAEKGIICK